MSRQAYLVGLCFSLYAVVGHTENLAEIYQIALQNDATFQAATAALHADKQVKPIAWAGLLPSASGTASAARKKTNQGFSPIVKGTVDVTSVGLSLTQPVFHLDRVFAVRQANKAALQAEASFIAATQDLIFRITQAYFNVLSAKDALHFTTGQKKAFAQQLEQTRKRFDVGLIATTDVQEAQARYDDAVAQEISAQSDLENAFEALREITNQPIQTLAQLKTKFTLEAPNPLDPEAWVKEAEQKNATLQAARYRAKAKKEAYHMAQAQHLPTLDLNGSFASNTNFVRSSNASADSVAALFGPPHGQIESIQLSVSMPLFTGGSTYAAAKQAGYSFEESKHLLEQIERATVSQTRQAFRGVNAQISQVHALHQAVISNRSALKATIAAYDAGSRTIVDVLDAQSNLFNAEKNYAQSRYRYILESFKLKQAAGRLSPDDILHVNEWLDYNVPYEDKESHVIAQPKKAKKVKTKKAAPQSQKRTSQNTNAI